MLALTGCSSEWTHRSDARTESQRINDGRLTSEVKDKLATEPVYKFKGVDVKVYDGIVQLSGFVNTDQQKSRAGELAQQVPGVGRVENALTIVPEPKISPTGRVNHAPVIGNQADQNTINQYPTPQNNQTNQTTTPSQPQQAPIQNNPNQNQPGQ